MKTTELTGAALDWAVAKCEGLKGVVEDGPVIREYYPSTDWSQGGPIIEREHIQLEWWHMSQMWHATTDENLRYDEQGEFVNDSDYRRSGLTPLIAAMRCYVASKLGDEVEIPDELNGTLSTL